MSIPEWLQLMISPVALTAPFETDLESQAFQVKFSKCSWTKPLVTKVFSLKKEKAKMRDSVLQMDLPILYH